MKNSITLLTILLVSAYSCSLPYLGENITKKDGQYENSAWHGPFEDQEVEPPDAKGQIWDLEGFFMNGNDLSLVGGFDFENGKQDPWRSGTDNLYTSGDIFIGEAGSVLYGAPAGPATTGYNTMDNVFGYEWAVDLDFENSEYHVFSLDKETDVITAYFKENRPSNPFQLASNDPSDAVFSGTFDYISGLTDAEIVTMGDNSAFLSDPDNANYYSAYNNNPSEYYSQTHNVITGIDLGFLPDGYEFLAHFTMGCGNDNIIGVSQVPEPGSLSLLSMGLFFLAGSLYLRKRKKRS